MLLTVLPRQQSRWRTLLAASVRARISPVDMETTHIHVVPEEASISVSTGAPRVSQLLLACISIECSNSNSTISSSNNNIDITNNNTVIVHQCFETLRHSTAISDPTPILSHRNRNYPPSNRHNSSACPVLLQHKQ